MPKGVAFDNNMLGLIFQASNISLLAQNANGGIGSLYVSLHTADPSGGNQNTNEVSYTSYNRVAVPRNNNGWSLNNNVVLNLNQIAFPSCTGGNNTAAWAAIGSNNSGTAGEVYYSAALNSSLVITNGITPFFANNSLSVSES
jgi:hypothetical protein